MDNKSISHTRWKCQYHIVFIPKYRKKVLYGKIREDVREIIRTLCKYKDVEIIAGAVCIDHVHLSVAIPPKLSISNLSDRHFWQGNSQTHPVPSQGIRIYNHPVLQHHCHRYE